jgi:hypothetical protein
MSSMPLHLRSTDAFVLGQRGLIDLLTTVNALGRSRSSTCYDLRRRLLGRNTGKWVILITLHNRAAQSTMRTVDKDAIGAHNTNNPGGVSIIHVAYDLWFRIPAHST